MSISALDENGQPVDWWFLYKVPQLKQDASTQSATGFEYVYFDPNQKEVARSPHVIFDGKGALDRTLKTVFSSQSSTVGWIPYNDEVPSDANVKNSSSLGHTKGVIAFDTASKTALWLLHSWPKYADPDAKAGKPTPEYGQTFLCLSLDLDTASKIAGQMANHQEPQVYLPNVAKVDHKDALYTLTQKLDPKAKGDSDALDFKTHGGMPFKVIAKNREWGKDFWNELVGPTLKEDMDVETWIRGKIPPVLDSDGIHKTFDIKYIDLSRLGAKWAWPESHDHAKWGITKGHDWICVGDINRMVSQENRGGGTIAFQSEILWNALSRTDLIVAPPGHSREEALDLIKSTHPAHAKKAKAAKDAGAD
jgi:deoxyribonuclease-2